MTDLVCSGDNDRVMQWWSKGEADEAVARESALAKREAVTREVGEEIAQARAEQRRGGASGGGEEGADDLGAARRLGGALGGGGEGADGWVQRDAVAVLQDEQNWNGWVLTVMRQQRRRGADDAAGAGDEVAGVGGQIETARLSFKSAGAWQRLVSHNQRNL
ncbi:hypothetical protein Syun_023244 [Stephania yunnanensis]|uniref:Uncharacterized protein n=1 Tax=Stephania yunnanensis TaxID=152371 RepID=A0AAP0HZF0_9MAGN